MFFFSEISSNKQREKNVVEKVAIMKMTEPKPRPLPKPRVRHTSSEHAPQPTTISPNISSSASANKPPITKPKPLGYKRLEFNNKFLVSIQADIDIGESPMINKEGNGRWEKNIKGVERNNNDANLKHGSGKVVIGNGVKDTNLKVILFMNAIIVQTWHSQPNVSTLQTFYLLGFSFKTLDA